VSYRDGFNISRGVNVLNTAALARFVEKPALVGHIWCPTCKHDRFTVQSLAP